MFIFVALYGRWEAGNSLKILSWGVGTFSTIENFILRTFIFRLFRTARPDTHLSNSGAKSTPAIAPYLFPTHPESSATKFCAGKCQNFFEISRHGPNHDQNVVPK